MHLMSNVDTELAERVRTWRKAQGMTQEQMAEAAGMKPRAYQNFEYARSTPQPAHLRGILRVAGIDAGDEVAEETRGGFTAKVQYFLDTMGIWLNNLDPDSQDAVIHDLTRQIVTGGISTVPRVGAQDATHG